MGAVKWGARGMQTLGFELDVILHAHGVSYSRLSRRLRNCGWPVSPQFIGMLCRGTRRTGPEQLNLICDVLNLTREKPQRPQPVRGARCRLSDRLDSRATDQSH